ncbi:zinc ribbon domain-containing protein [Leptospirillum ferrooxidans]|uniref:zinc ribbon domain-containing protein n=1 Tax=Leptospirillum ferrooxidans TaxID=180 RepID=UPI0022B75AE1|nr:zinc ribbon domain-containing protein [Leptospirillum ferrooxidans]
MRRFITCKAVLEDVPVVLVDPPNTSSTCSLCGDCEKGNRTSKGHFSCLICKRTEHADINAARTIRFKAAINRPIAV